MEEPSRTFSHPAQQPADAAGSTACGTCRLAHASCDRAQPCGRCVRLGKTETCQPPPTRKRGRPRKGPPPDDQPQQQQAHAGTLAVPPHHHHHDDHHQPQPPPPPHTIITQAQAAATAAAAASKRFCVRRKTTDPVIDPPGDSQPPHAAPAPAAGPHCFSSSSSASSSSSPSSLSPAAEEDWASLWSPPPPSQPAAGSLPSHQRFTQPAPARTLPGQGQQEQDSQEGLRSLLMLVVDQVREMRRENEHLHDTIAQLRATQKQTQRRLARVEQDHEIKSRQLEQTESRLARVEADHQTKSRLLEQTRIELNDHVMAHHRDHVRDHAHASSTFPPPPPPFSSETAVVAPPRCELQLVAAVAGSTTPRAEVEQFIAQTLPFLQEFDCSSLILRDLQRPFIVSRMKEAETLDDLDTPVIVYMSPSMCELLGYDMLELHGSRLTSICSPRPEYLAAFVRVILMRPPTRVGQPLFLSRGPLITKQGRNVQLSTAHQFLYNQRRLAQYQIMQVNSVLETDLGSAPHMRPISSIVHDPIVRAHLLARLPHSLLFGCQGEMTSTQLSPHQHHTIEDLTVEEAAALMAAMTQHHQHQRPPGRQVVMARAQGSEEVDDDDDDNDNDSELNELMRVLGLPIESGVRASPFSRLVMGFNSSRPPPTTPATLAERWMR